MLKKVLSKSGLRILKAIKKLSTKTRPKSSQNVLQKEQLQLSPENRKWGFDHEAVSLSWSLASLDTKSIDTYLTLVSDENGTGVDNPTTNCYTDDYDNDKKCYCCCCCVEYETENQRNENRENEMFD